MEPINNLDLYQLAFIHKSYVKDNSNNTSIYDDIGHGIDENDIDKDGIDTMNANDINNINININNVDVVNNIDVVNNNIDVVNNNIDVVNNNIDDKGDKDGNKIMQFQDKPYERLEYIGDAILNAVIASYVFSRFPNEPEGFLTTLRTKLVRSQTLAKLTAKLQIQKWIIISKHVEEKCNGRNNPRILEDIFEALVGALFLDFGAEHQGWRVCYRFIVSVFETFVDITTMIRKEDNYKRILLEFYQKKFRTEPKYQVISLRGPTNRRSYTMGALSPAGEIVGIGISKRKTDAEQMASKKALMFYNEDVGSDDSDSE